MRTNVPILSGCGVKVTTHLHLVPNLRMSGAIPLLLMHAFIAMTAKKFTIYLLPILNDSKIFTVLI
jgi:hypothetical protein